MSLMRKMSLKKKLTLCVSVLLACIFLICGFFINCAFEIYNQTLYSGKAGEISAGIRQIEEELLAVEALSEEYMVQQELQDALELWGGTEDAYTRSVMRTELEEYLTRLITRKQYIEGAVLEDAEKNSIVKTRSQLSAQRFYEAISPDEVPEDGSAYWLEPQEGSNLFTAVRTVRRIRDVSFAGIGRLYIVVDMDALIRHACPGSLIRDMSMFIYGENKIYNIGVFSDRAPVERFLTENTAYSVRTEKGVKYFMLRLSGQDTGYDYVAVLEFDQLFSNVVRFNTIVIVFFVLLFVLLLILCGWSIRKLLYRVESLCDTMQTMENGTLALQMPEDVAPDSRDEFDILTRQFYKMANEIDILINEKYKKEILLRETQLKILHSQVKPHFLYNTLETINWMAITKGQQEISALVKALGNLLRSSIGKNQFVVTVEEELRLLQDYILIQKKRFGEALEVSFHVAEELYAYSILKLSIQILVENSIKHGLERNGSLCSIAIRIEHLGGLLHISVSDNGPGIAEEVISGIKNGTCKSTGGIGLENIEKRIKLIYGEAYGLDIQNGAEGGVTVTMRIPARQVHFVDKLSKGGAGQ